MTTYTHIGSRGYVGHYAVTADAIRTPGKAHALNCENVGFRSLCGVFVNTQSDDHFLDRNPVQPAPDAAGAGVRCSRCRAALGLRRWAVQFRNGSFWSTYKGHAAHVTRADAEAGLAEFRRRFPMTRCRVRAV